MQKKQENGPWIFIKDLHLIFFFLLLNLKQYDIHVCTEESMFSQNAIVSRTNLLTTPSRFVCGAAGTEHVVKQLCYKCSSFRSKPSCCGRAHLTKWLIHGTWIKVTENLNVLYIIWKKNISHFKGSILPRYFAFYLLNDIAGLEF